MDQPMSDALGANVDRDVSAGAGRRVLLVDDHADASLMLASLLEVSGFRVQRSPAAEVVKEFAAFAPDLALIDLKMPVYSGFDVMGLLHSNFGARTPCRFIAASGLGGPIVMDACRKAGFHGHLMKPFGLQELHAAMGCAKDRFFHC